MRGKPAISVIISLVRMSIFAFVCVELVLSSCVDIPSPPPKARRFVMVLLDETGSFKMKDPKTGEDKEFWPEILNLTKKIISGLQPGEGFGIIGIDDHGFDGDDVRLQMTLLDENALLAKQQKDKLKKEVQGLVRRGGKRPYTDILGALYHAAHFLDNEKNRRSQLIIFSDMIQTPKWPTQADAEKLHFPPKTSGFCFYVDATGKNKWDRILQVWVPLFQNAGVSISKDDFFQIGNVQLGMQKILPEGRGH